MDGIKELKKFLLTVDRARDETSVAQSKNKIASKCVCARFVDEIIQILDTSEIKTLKQFQKCKMEDIDWPEGTLAEKKFFVRMAWLIPKTSESDRWCVTVWIVSVAQSLHLCVHRQGLALVRARPKQKPFPAVPQSWLEPAAAPEGTRRRSRCCIRGLGTRT